ncbi:MAG: 30S ribosomal protein S8 [Leptospiraceae bacterium]|nr:30S ribosomal protein S8 [Leptospiraceae bacterium]MCP5496653.1 30S ribosomal protein S8 [Leptospiraceae bacterium]
MSLSDPIADMLTRIRNASRAGHPNCMVSYSNIKKSVLEILQSEGFIKEFQLLEENNKKDLQVALKYTPKKKPVIQEIIKISRPGRRVYQKWEEIKPVKSNLGISVISTSKGIMTNKKARNLRVGGEVIFKVS